MVFDQLAKSARLTGCLGLVVCTLSTTVHEFSPVNQLLIGLIAGSACINPTAMQQELNESSRQQP